MDARLTAMLGAPRVIGTVLYNVLPVIGVLFWGWDAFALVFLYWIENVAIGVRNVASMLATGFANGPAAIAAAVFFGAFFTVHFGGFCLGHAVFIIALLSDQPNMAFDLRAVFANELNTNLNFAVGVAAVALWQVVEFVLFLRRGEHRRTTVPDLMGGPYYRIIILHVAIIATGFALVVTKAPQAMVALLALLKTCVDLGFTLRTERRDAAAAA